MRFSDAFLRALRERVSIADYAGKRLAWDRKKSQPAKGDYWACCPFHTEKSASFHVLDGKGIYKCFGCGAAGDVFTLSMKLEGGGFPETVERIANFAGVPLPVDEREDKEDADRRRRLYAAMARAAALYGEALRGGEGRTARAYLAARGFSSELCQRFGIGYAPGGWTWLIDKLKGEFQFDDLVEAGLAKPGEENRRAIDFLRERITFEIADAGGKVIAFGGRTLDPSNPAKYINSPETPLFHKGRTLYRLKQARETLAKSKAPNKEIGGLVVGEGYLDVIAFERAGVGAVAPLGTALTDDQLQLLWRAGGEPVLCFDGDAAGQRAAERALDLALPHLGPGRTIKIAVLPAGQDPDDVYRNEGGEALKAMIAQAQGAASALFARERARAPLDTPEAKAAFKKRLKDAAHRIADEETRRLYLKELLAKADEVLGYGRSFPPPAGAFQPRRGEGRKGGRWTPPPAGATVELKAFSAGRRDANAERLVRLAVDHPALLDRAADALARLETRDREVDCIKSALLSLWYRTQSVDRAALSLHLRQSGETRAAARLDAWPRPKISKEDMERDWMALAAPESARPETLAEPGQTGERVAIRGGLKAKAARPRPINALNEAEWEAAIGADLASAATRQEARALRDSVDEDPAAMARAQELLRDRLRAASEALLLSQRAGDHTGEDNGAEDD